LTSSYTGDLKITTRKGILTTRSVDVFEGVPSEVGVPFDRIDGMALRYSDTCRRVARGYNPASL
jgi:hypothetical protein